MLAVIHRTLRSGPAWLRGLGILLTGLAFLQGCAQTQTTEHGPNPQGDSRNSASQPQSAAYKTYKSALSAQKREDYEAAAALYTDVLNLADRRLYASAHINRAYAYKELMRYEDSLQDHNAYLQIKKASGHKPSSRQFYLSRADVLAELGRYNEARADLKFAQTFVGKSDTKRDAVLGITGDTATVATAILYDKIGDRSESLRIINAALKELSRNHDPTKDGVVYMALYMDLLTRSVLYTHAANYEAALKDIRNAETAMAFLFTGDPSVKPSNELVRPLMRLSLLLYRAYILDLSNQRSAAIATLQDARRTVSKLASISPEEEEEEKLNSELDLAIQELSASNGNQHSQALHKLFLRNARDLNPSIGFTEQINLNG